MLLEQLRDDWFARLRSGPIDAVPRFAEQGMVLGAGTVLLACEGGRQLQQVEGQEARLSALLSAACGKVLPRKVAGNFERAAKCWSAGDECLAYIHLAHEAGRQIAASGGRPVRWYFAEAAAADFARELFRDCDKGLERVDVEFLPWMEYQR